MGIRFHCPNGHRLNVKAHLAGKRGFCPHCNARVQIPALPSEQVVPPELLAEDFALPPDLRSDDARPDGQGWWYVRPPSGGQFGPVDLDQLRRWIAEQRVPRDSLLLKEGWPDWRLAEPLIAAGFVEEDQGDSDRLIQLDQPTPPTMVHSRSNEKRRIRAALVLMMTLLTVGLLAVLALILNLSR